MLRWDKVTAIVYEDEIVYDGDTFNYEFPATGMTWGSSGYVTDKDNARQSPDSVMGEPPRPKPRTRSIIKLTVTHDVTTKDIKIFRDELVGGCLLNADPRA